MERLIGAPKTDKNLRIGLGGGIAKAIIGSQLDADTKPPTYDELSTLEAALRPAVHYSDNLRQTAVKLTHEIAASKDVHTLKEMGQVTKLLSEHGDISGPDPYAMQKNLYFEMSQKLKDQIAGFGKPINLEGATKLQEAFGGKKIITADIVEEQFGKPVWEALVDNFDQLNKNAVQRHNTLKPIYERLKHATRSIPSMGYDDSPDLRLFNEAGFLRRVINSNATPDQAMELFHQEMNTAEAIRERFTPIAKEMKLNWDRMDAQHPFIKALTTMVKLQGIFDANWDYNFETKRFSLPLTGYESPLAIVKVQSAVTELLGREGALQIDHLLHKDFVPVGTPVPNMKTIQLSLMDGIHLCETVEKKRENAFEYGELKREVLTSVNELANLGAAIERVRNPERQR